MVHPRNSSRLHRRSAPAFHFFPRASRIFRLMSERAARNVSGETSHARGLPRGESDRRRVRNIKQPRCGRELRKNRGDAVCRDGNKEK